MSMLAEPKRKIKWSLNPRGALWANDDAKYGQKLLEKMGWKKGKGLGKLENGRIEHIKVTYKNDSKGIGCNDKNENWIAHQDEFNAILSGLNQQHSVENIGNSDGIRPLKNFSLELKSRTSRSRVHYQKFVRGKDLSQYREEDMNSIFGTKSCEVLSSSMKIPNAERSKPSAEEKEESELNNFNGVATYKSAKTMSDYFSEKMKKIKQVHLFENNNITSEKILSNCEVDNENFLQKKSVEKKKWKEQKKNSEEIVASHVKAVTPSFDDQVSEIIVRHSDSPDTSNLKKSVPSKSSQISIHHQQKCNSFSDLSAHDSKCKMADGNSIQETNAAMKERKKKKHRPLKFSEADNDSISNLSVSHEIIPEISATNNDLKNAVVSDNKTKNDRKNMLEKDSHEIIVITSSRKRKCVSCSSSESLGSSKKKRKNDLKRCSADKLKSCLKECVVNGLKKIKKKVTFNEKLEFFKEEVSDESDTSNNIEIEDHANKEKNVFNEQGSELKGHNTQLQTSDIHDRLTIQLKDYENSTKTCSASDSENMLMTYLSTTVNGSPRLNNEPWVASQKLAMKLSHYQGMLKDLKSNKSLSTSNLLDIRGYGNW